jgi:ketosteroid isomerase-like protein
VTTADDVNALMAASRRGALPEIAGALGPAARFRAGIELFNRRDLDLLAALLPADFVHDMRPTGIPGMGVYRGPEGYRGFLDQWLEAFSDAALEEEQLELSGEVVFAIMRQTTSGRASGVPVDFRYASVIEYRDGAVRRSVFDTDIERARTLFREVAATDSASRQAPDP